MAGEKLSRRRRSVAKKDVPVPDNVRLYYFSGTQHGPTDKPDRGMCQQLTNPLSYRKLNAR